MGEALTRLLEIIQTNAWLALILAVVGWAGSGQ